MKNLNAVTLKQTLWETLNLVKEGKMEPSQADAVASQAREILRTTNTQMGIIGKIKAEVSDELKDFAICKKEN